MYNHITKRIFYLVTHPKRNKNKFLYFLVSIILLIAFIPFAEEDLITAAFLNLLTTIIILTGVYAVSETRSHIYISSLLGIPLLLINWINLFIYHRIPGPEALSWGVLFFIYTTIIVFVHVIKSSKVNIETLYGAVTVYLLIGITYTAIFVLIESLSPGSFDMSYKSDSNHTFHLHEMLYYSYITLTTLGYGDITPVKATTRILSISEAVIGQLYLAILVARLVGLHIFSISKNR